MNTMKNDELLSGAYDLHVHAGPDVVPRRQDLVDLARSAAQARMAGIVLKDHCLPTQGRAYTLNRLIPDGVRFFGCLALNAPVGGLNPVAVESFLREGGRVVFMPTYCAANHIRIWGRGKPPTAFPLPTGNYPGIELLGSDGKLKPEVLEVIYLVKEYDAVLGTGHVSPAEGLAALEAAAVVGVKRLVVTHVSEPVTAYNTAQQLEAIRLGAMLEHCVFAATEACPGEVTLEDIRDQIARTGPENVIISTDFGQPPNPDPVAALAQSLGNMADLGLHRRALRVMTRDNPHRLLEG
jgi:hypothetical protein